MATDRSSDDHFDEMGGGPLGSWDLAFSLWAVQDFLRVIQKERDQLEVAVRCALEEDVKEDLYTTRAHSLAFMEVACSQAAVGAVAPLFETLLRKVAARLRETKSKPAHPEAHHRSQLKDDEFWDPAVLAVKGVRGPHDNLLAGFQQLLKVLKLSENIPKSCWLTFEAIVTYRNAALHEGYQWSPERLESFRKTAEKEKWDWYGLATLDGKPWLISVEDKFWTTAIEQIEEVASIMRQVCSEGSKPEST